MQTLVFMDLMMTLYAEREALARVYDFYWERTQESAPDDCSFERERLLVIEQEHIKIRARIEALTPRTPLSSEIPNDLSACINCVNDKSL
jgi:hypothetical protein